MKEKYMFTCSSSHYLCSGITDLALGILNMLICVCFRDFHSSNFILVLYDFEPVFTVNVLSIYSKCLPSTGISYVQ